MDIKNFNKNSNYGSAHNGGFNGKVSIPGREEARRSFKFNKKAFQRIRGLLFLPFNFKKGMPFLI